MPPHVSRLHARDSGLRTVRRITAWTAAGGVVMSGGLAVLAEHAFSGVRAAAPATTGVLDPGSDVTDAPQATVPAAPAATTPRANVPALAPVTPVPTVATPSAVVPQPAAATPTTTHIVHAPVVASTTPPTTVAPKRRHHTSPPPVVVSGGS